MKDGKEDAVLQIYGQSRPEGEGFSDPDIKIPGALGNITTITSWFRKSSK